MIWQDPNWVGAIGQWAGALAGLLAVVVALGIALFSNTQMQRQLRISVRPRLVIETNDTTLWQKKNDLYLEWNSPYLMVRMKNIGSGPAFNIVSVIYGSESYPGELGKPRIPGNEEHWTCWADDVLPSASSKVQQYNVGASTFYMPNRMLQHKKHCYSFHSPPVPDFQLQKPSPRYIARITTTYHDVYRKKHASIFDADDMGRLKFVAFLEDIHKDLQDLADA